MKKITGKMNGVNVPKRVHLNKLRKY